MGLWMHQPLLTQKEVFVRFVHSSGLKSSGWRKWRRKFLAFWNSLTFSLYLSRKKNVPKSHAIEELLCYSTHPLVLKLLEKYSSVPSKYIYFLAGKRTIICVCFLIFSFLKGSLLHNFVLSCLTSTMSIKMKGIYKSFKYISKIFVVKEREIEIGYPTDVKHVAHIGLDGTSGSAPSWMNEFKTASEFSTASLGSLAEFRDSSSMALSTWSSQDFDQSMGRQQACDMFRDIPPTDLPNVPKKQKRKKYRSTSSPKSSSSSSRSSRAAKSKTAFNDMDATSNLKV